MLCTVLFLAILPMAAAQTVNYCGAKMCGHTNAHTFCQYPPGPSPKCVGYMNAHLSPEEKVRLIARFNRRRSEAASGRLRHMPTAGNMLKLRWVEELAREAQRWADQCRPPQTPEERDTCRDLFSISVGQCVASVVGEAPGLRVESMVDLWYMQSMHYRENVTSFVVPVSNVNYYGDFAQMIWARSYMVGCGRSRFMAEVNGRMRSVERLVCNLAPKGPSAGRPLWGLAPPAAACPPRSIEDPVLPALCNFQADLDVSTDVDGALTIEEHVLLSTVLEIENQEPLNYMGSLDELYLTKMAIVTMDDSVTQVLPYSNSVQKRNIPMLVEVEVNDNFIVNITKQHMNETFDNKDKTQMMNKKVNTVGRPKPYNMEELIDVDGEQNTSEEINDHDMPRRDIPKIERDWYLDYYDVSATQETNMTSCTEYQSNNNENVTLSTLDSMAAIKSNYESTAKTEFIQTPYTDYTLVESSSITVNIETLKMLINDSKVEFNQSLSTKADDDYLTDPETVREIQEALERMERSLQEPPPNVVKVRRELRESSPSYNQENSTYSESTNQEEIPEQQNKTFDKQPLLSMIMKYLPYLKPYEKEIMGRTTASRSTCLQSTNIILLSCDVLVMSSYVF